MRVVRLASCLALWGCATASTPETAAAPETVRVQTGAGAMMVSTTANIPSHRASVAFPPERVWSVIRAVYDSLGIPVTVFDPASHTIGNAALRVRRRLGDTALSKYLNCGTTQGGPSADTYELQMSVTTVVGPDGPGTSSVTTTVQGQGRPITLSSEYTACSSTGGLEIRVLELVKARLR